MSPTVWTEQTATAATYTEGVPVAYGIATWVLFGFPLPADGAVAYGSTEATYTEMTANAASYTEMNLAAATVYTEMTG